MQVNWKFMLPFAIIAVIAVVLGGMVMMGMGGSEGELAVAPSAPTANVPASPTSEATANPVAGVTVTAPNTGDPVADIDTVLSAEGTGDASLMSTAGADAALVGSDSADLSALTTTYDATSF